jgi:threonine/homoserine efflux transporter RhtA
MCNYLSGVLKIWSLHVTKMFCGTIQCLQALLELIAFTLPTKEFCTLVFCFPTHSTVNGLSLLDVEIATIDCLLTAAVCNVGHTDEVFFSMMQHTKRQFSNETSCKCQNFSV